MWFFLFLWWIWGTHPPFTCWRKSKPAGSHILWRMAKGYEPSFFGTRVYPNAKRVCVLTIVVLSSWLGFWLPFLFEAAWFLTTLRASSYGDNEGHGASALCPFKYMLYHALKGNHTKVSLKKIFDINLHLGVPTLNALVAVDNVHILHLTSVIAACGLTLPYTFYGEWRRLQRKWRYVKGTF